MKRSLNLMSEKSQKLVLVHSCVRMWSRVAVGAVVILAVIGIVEWRVCANGSTKVAAAEAEYEPIRQLKIESGRLKKKVQSLRDTERIALALAEDKPVLSLVGLATQAVRQQRNKLYLNKMEIVKEPVARKPTDHAGIFFAIEGVSTSKDFINNLVDDLKTAGLFEAVDMKSNSTVRRDQSAPQSFLIQASN